MLSSLIGSRKFPQGQNRPQQQTLRLNDTFKHNGFQKDEQGKFPEKSATGAAGTVEAPGMEQASINMSPLYGNNSLPPSSAFKISDKLSFFRLVVVQDAGIRRKQPLFDSALPCNINVSKMNQKLNKANYHSINELSLFMFGCYGIPISENNTTTKIHYLPSLSNLHSSILITRLFSLDSTFKLKLHALSVETNEWETHPILEDNEIPLLQNASRFSIGMVIPIFSSIESVTEEVTNNWVSILESLKEMQNLVISRLQIQYEINQNKLRQLQKQNNHIMNNNIQPLQSNKLTFSIYSLQSEVELFQSLALFLRSLVSLVETPRLFIDLKHSNQSLINWASNLSLWKELKDGRNYEHFNDNFHHDTASESFLSPSYSNQHYPPHQIKFLASLLTLLIPYKNSLFNNANNSTLDEFFSNVRVIIGTGNPAISEKLIFIISGIIGYDEFSKLYENYEMNTRKNVYQRPDFHSKISTDNTLYDQAETYESRASTNSSYNPPHHPSRSPTPLSSYPPGSVTHPSQYSQISSQSSVLSPPSSPRTPLPMQRNELDHTLPIPISKEMKEKTPEIQTRSGSLYVNSLSSSIGSKNFKSSPLCIPQSPSIATVSASINTERINTPLSRTSSYASLQCLSTSYSANVPNSIGSQTPSSSWRNNFGSFMDRWKSSITPSPTTSHFSQLSQPVSQYSRQDSTSPSLSEYNEYPWFGKKPVNSPTVSSSSSFISSSINNANRFTIKNNPHLSSYTCEPPTLQIKRTPTKLVIPHASKLSENIKNEINFIMDGHFDYTMDNNDMRSVVDVSFDDSLINNNISCINEFELPLMTGYVSQFKSEFHLQSCNNKQLLESTFIETMRHDLDNLKCNNTEIFFINLGMHRITHFEMEAKERVIYEDPHNRESLKMSRSDSGLKSNLTKSMECAKNLHQTTLLTSSKPLNNENTQGKFNIDHAIEDRVEQVDQILEKIVWTITNFFYEIDKTNFSSDEDVTLNKEVEEEAKEANDKRKIEKENECCNEIRSLISKMLEITG